MGFAPKGLKVGDVFEDCGKMHKVVKVVHTDSYDGYETEIVVGVEETVEEAVEEIVEEEQISLADIPFSDVKEEPKKRTRKKAE